MTLMTNDLNDHHDRMVVVEVFCFMIKKAKPDALSSARLLLILNPRYNPLTSFAKHIT